MATIFERVPASGEKCLILDSKESLTYPFDFGDWEEIVVCAALSLTDEFSSNGVAQEERLNNVKLTDYSSSMYFGIKSNNQFYPDPQKCSYIGIGPYQSYQPDAIKVEQDNNYWKIKYSDGFSPLVVPSGAINSQPLTYAFLDMVLPSTFNQTGSNTNFCNLCGLKIRIKNKGTSNQSYSVAMYRNTSQQNSFYPSLENMRSISKNLINQLEGIEFTPTPDTGFFTTTFNNSGIPAPIPDAFYLYNPFILNRLRVHGILIEKYS